MNRSDIFFDAIEFLNSENIEFVVLGDVRGYPEHIGSDLDICILNSSFSNCNYIVQKFTSIYDFKYIQCLKHEINAFYYVIVGCSGSSFAFFQLDFCDDYYRNHKLFIRKSDLLENKKVVSLNSELSYYIPSDTSAFLYYLLKRSSKRDFTKVNINYLNQLDFDPNFLAGFFKNRDLLNYHLSLVSSRNIKSLNEACRSILGNYNFPRQSFLSNYLSEGARIINRIMQPTGYCIAILGPDGSGKTTLSNAFLKDVEHAFRGVKRYHLRPYAFENKDGFGGPPTLNPHGRPSRSLLSSILKLGWFFIDYTFGYIITARFYKLKSHLVFFDRYYHDLIIDPKRYRFGASLWIASLLGKIVAKPDLFIVLTGDPQTIWARKKEVSFEETERQIKAYEDFSKETKNSLLIDTDRDIEYCSHQVSQYILFQLAKRYD